MPVPFIRLIRPAGLEKFGWVWRQTAGVWEKMEVQGRLCAGAEWMIDAILDEWSNKKPTQSNVSKRTASGGSTLAEDAHTQETGKLYKKCIRRNTVVMAEMLIVGSGQKEKKTLFRRKGTRTQSLRACEEKPAGRPEVKTPPYLLGKEWRNSRSIRRCFRVV